MTAEIAAVAVSNRWHDSSDKDLIMSWPEQTFMIFMGLAVYLRSIHMCLWVLDTWVW